MAAQTGQKKRLRLATQVVIALALGLAADLFSGDLASPLRSVGRAFILLLQMTVLPYIMLSLITGLGHLNYQEIKNLGLRVGSLQVLSWALAFAAILIMPLAFPALETASFFSASLVKMPESVNFLELFIPSNPFHALANNLVPAVVLFSIAVGVALIGLEPKADLLTSLTVLNRAMARVTQFVSTLTPIGVFAIVASAAGTMGLEALGRLQVYLLTYVAIALLLGLWVLPALITNLTRLTYGQVIGATRDVLITSFATRSALIVLPLLIERSKELLRQSQLSTAETLVYSAESGSAWTLLYPAYSVAIPQPDALAAPMAYLMAQGNEEMVDLINHWLLLKRKNGAVQSLYNYWVLGKNTTPEAPRWSEIRDVLHWVK